MAVCRVVVRLLVMVPLVLLGACDLGPDFLRPQVEMPVQFRATDASQAEAWPSEDWWRGFNSPELNDLIEQARAQNFDIAAAIARPKAVHFVTLLPKTRSGKTLRRSIQALAEGRDPGDLTTIEDPSALEQIRNALR